MSDPRYPIGKFQYREGISDKERGELIQHIADAPAKLRDSVKGLSDQQLDTPYREGGWTVRQVVHHVPDSHMNAYTRLKLALTETEPTIKPYNEKLWAELPDGRAGAVAPSLQLLESLHHRWVILLHSLTPVDYLRTFRHPESGQRTLDWLIQLYAWHSRHHVAHITSLRDRMKW